MIIVNSILIASINHILLVFHIPTSIANTIDVLIARVFWANNPFAGIAWRKKKVLHLLRGMGIWNVSTSNNALLILAHIKTPELLLSKVFSTTNSIQILVKLLASPRTDDIKLKYTLNAIKEEASSFSWCCVRKVNRNQVQQAHILAQDCKRNVFNLPS